MSKPYARADTAQRYDAARTLAAETTALWMGTLQSLLPVISIRQVLDLGCGTGRFAAGLKAAFGCSLIGVEPSATMLEQARNRAIEEVVWSQGSAEQIPLQDETVDLVWMSQIVHHLDQPAQAFAEVWRVLRPGGCLAIRNATRDHQHEIQWLTCFPEARQFDDQRIPSQRTLVDLVCSQGFQTIAIQTVQQFFATSYAEYTDKIQQRSLSALIQISDEAFQDGLARLKVWAAAQPPNQPIHEPIDLFVFQVKKG